MKYLWKWSLPSGLVIHRHEEVEHPEHWGRSYFWYCRFCAETYASAQLFMETEEEAIPRPWQALGGVCPDCPSDKWSIAGTIESIITVGWHVPVEVAAYQLGREIVFLDHPEHPHNKGVCENA